MIGGQVAAGTPAPQGASWFSSTQLSAASAPMMNSTAPVLMLTRLAPGAAPCIFVPSGRVTSRPATMPLTCMPWPPTESRSVLSDPASTGAQKLSVSGSQSILRFLTTALVPSAFCRNGWVGSTPESITATETPLPSRARAVGAGEGVAGLVAAGRLVGGRQQHLDRLVALDVGHAGLRRAPAAPGRAARSRRRRRSCRTRSPCAGRRPARPWWRPPVSVPCTSTVVGVAALSTPSWEASQGWTGASGLCRRAAGLRRQAWRGPWRRGRPWRPSRRRPGFSSRCAWVSFPS